MSENCPHCSQPLAHANAQYCVQCNAPLTTPQPLRVDGQNETAIRDSLINRSSVDVQSNGYDVAASMSDSVISGSDVSIKASGTSDPGDAPTNRSASIQTSDNLFYKSTIEQNITIGDPLAAEREKFEGAVWAVLEQGGVQALIDGAATLEGQAIDAGLTSGEALRIQQELRTTYKTNYAARDRLRPKYRLAKQGDVICEDRLLTADEVVEFVGSHRDTGYFPRVDIDASGELRPVWTVEEIAESPRFELRCSQTTSVLSRDTVESCEHCHRPFGRGILVDRICAACASRSSVRPPIAAPMPTSVGDLSSRLDSQLWRRIPAGAFMMGSTEDEEGRSYNEKRHEVRITRDFFVTNVPVTERLFAEVAGGSGNRDDYPQTGVSWMDAVRFCNAYSDRLGLPKAYVVSGDAPEDVQWHEEVQGIRLLSEAEWEYACRAGTQGPYYKDVGEDLFEIAVYETEELEPLREGEANAFGLYDMLGTVLEWVWDGQQDYEDHPHADPRGAPTHPCRGVRGGGYSDLEEDCRCAKRCFIDGTHASKLQGFRLAVTA